MALKSELQPQIHPKNLKEREENSQTPPEDTEKITLYEEDLYETPKIKEEAIQLVVFRLGSEWYGVEITKVKEVIKVKDMTYLPSAPEYIAGIVSLRGNILSITDLRKFLGLPQEEPSGKPRPVVVVSGDFEMGFLVDEVAEATDVAVSKIAPPLTTISPEKVDYIEGQCQIGNKLIAILKVEKILRKYK